MNNSNAAIQMDIFSSQKQRHQHQPPSDIGLNEVLSLIQTQDDMRELLIRVGRL